MMPVRLEPVASLSGNKKSTTEQLCSLLYTVGFAAYTYPQFQNSYEFSLDGGVILTLWSIARSIVQMEC